MNCKMANDYIMKYFDGNLNDIESAYLKQHTRTCSRCSNEFAELEEVLQHLETTGFVEPPADFEQNVIDKINLLEITRKKRTDGLLFILNGIAAFFLLILSLAVAADLKYDNIYKFIGELGQSISSLTNIIFTVHHFFEALYTVVINVTGVLIQISLMLVKEYYYIFIFSLIFLGFLQKVFAVLVRQDGGRTR